MQTSTNYPYLFLERHVIKKTVQVTQPNPEINWNRWGEGWVCDSLSSKV